VPMSTARFRPGVIELNGQLYVVGGFTDCKSSCTMECYNPDTNSWTTKASLIKKVNNFGVI